MRALIKAALLALLMLGATALAAQIEYYTTITSVSMDAISVEVTAVNMTGYATLPLSVDDWPWLKLFVDGQWDQIAPDSTGMGGGEVLIIWSEYTFSLSYDPPEPIPLGMHQVDVRRYDAPYSYVHFLDPLQVEVVSPFAHIVFTSQITSVTPTRLEARVMMHNASASDCLIDYPDNLWLQMYIDGTQVTPSYQSNPAWLLIPAQNWFTANILYLPGTPIPYGTHQLQFRVQDYGYLQPLGFNLVDPSAAEDDLEPVFAGLRVAPNPFSGEARIQSAARISGQRIRIYDLRGQLVRELAGAAGSQQNEWVWDGRDARGDRLPSGVYLFSCEPGGMRTKALLVR